MNNSIETGIVINEIPDAGTALSELISQVNSMVNQAETLANAYNLECDLDDELKSDFDSLQREHEVLVSKFAQQTKLVSDQMEKLREYKAKSEKEEQTAIEIANLGKKIGKQRDDMEKRYLAACAERDNLAKQIKNSTALAKELERTKNRLDRRIESCNSKDAEIKKLNKAIRIQKEAGRKREGMEDELLEKINYRGSLLARMRHIMILEGHIPHRTVRVNNVKYYLYRKPADVAECFKNADTEQVISPLHKYYIRVESSYGVHRDIIPLLDQGEMGVPKALPIPKEVKAELNNIFTSSYEMPRSPDMDEGKSPDVDDSAMSNLLRDVDTEIFENARIDISKDEN